MAVASFHRDGKQVAMRGFHPPSKSNITAWYRAAVGQIEDAPDWRSVDMGAAVIDRDTIVFHGDGWDLFIARRRNLK